eukprot:TRINITY_DN39918_c0_g1_i1.p2 TRINITY_DN39918_c0_g1~~TRINITY_DN39918_c0_g1_i1.p2  ORF type:complete len:106 (+),score=29.49 TRINITY_DN39918_c0_g1_i1:47-364(+)
MLFFFFKQKTAYEMQRGLVGSEMCIRDSFPSVSVSSVKASINALPWSDVPVRRIIKFENSLSGSDQTKLFSRDFFHRAGVVLQIMNLFIKRHRFISSRFELFFEL